MPSDMGGISPLLSEPGRGDRAGARCRVLALKPDRRRQQQLSTLTRVLFLTERGGKRDKKFAESREAVGRRQNWGETMKGISGQSGHLESHRKETAGEALLKKK